MWQNGQKFCQANEKESHDPLRLRGSSSGPVLSLLRSQLISCVFAFASRKAALMFMVVGASPSWFVVRFSLFCFFPVEEPPSQRAPSGTRPWPAVAGYLRSPACLAPLAPVLRRFPRENSERPGIVQTWPEDRLKQTWPWREFGLICTTRC